MHTGWYYVAVIVAIIIILIVLLIIYTDNPINDIDTETIVFMSTESSRPLDTIRDAVLYTKSKPTFVGLTETTAYDAGPVCHIGSTKTSKTNNFTTGNNVLKNTSPGYVGGYQELQYKDNYIAVDSYNYVMDFHEIFNGQYEDVILYQRLKNKLTQKILHFFNFSKIYGTGYFSDNNNYSAFAIFTKIKSIIGEDSFIAVGNTSVVGWEIIAKYVLGNIAYYSGDLLLPTINDDQGLAQIDAIIVSKNYCTRLDIIITFSPFSFNRQHFLMCVRIFKGSSRKKGFNISKKNRNMLMYYVENIIDNNFMNPYTPAWDPTIHTTQDQELYWTSTNTSNDQKDLVSVEDIYTLTQSYSSTNNNAINTLTSDISSIQNQISTIEDEITRIKNSINTEITT